MANSKLQQLAADQIKATFPDIVIKQNYRARWLKGEMNRLYELDIFLPELNMGIEVQGRQHYEHIPFFHGKSPDGLSAQLERDDAKQKLCMKSGVILLEIYNEEEVKDIVSLVTAYRQNIHCLEFTPTCWARERRGYTRAILKPIIDGIKTQNAIIKRQMGTPPRLRSLSALRNAKTLRYELTRQKEKLEYECAINFLEKYAFYYRLHILNVASPTRHSEDKTIKTKKITYVATMRPRLLREFSYAFSGKEAI